jgi:hypothetical protein
MSDQPDEPLFKSWQRALAEGKLMPEQLKVLQDMLDSGQASSIENAAGILDWQDGIIDPEEHMYGF